MADKPILFQPEMVRGLLREIAEPGTGKTQTRRLIIPQPALGRIVQSDTPYVWGDEEGETQFKVKHAVGDRLYVREAWRTISALDGSKPSSLDAGHRCKVTYEADPENRRELWHFGRLRASMHLPKIFSRMTLMVSDVRVQRLQDISDEDALAEGIIDHRQTIIGAHSAGGFHHEIMARGYHWLEELEYSERPEDDPTFHSATDAYADLWDSINADPKPKFEGGKISHYESFPWDGDPREEEHRGLPHVIIPNPWVSATTFKPVYQNIDLIGDSHE